MKTIKKKKILLVSTADWSAQLLTNKQYMAKELAKSFEVIYLESTPHRNIRLNLADIIRVAKRLFRTMSRTATKSNEIQIVSPLVLPFFIAEKSSLIRKINQAILKWQIKEFKDEISLIWTFTPLLHGLEHLNCPIVYHSVDLIHEIPGNHRDLILEAERKLSFFELTYCIASSSGVKEHLHNIGFEEVDLWPNVAKRLNDEDISTSLRQETVIFVGNLVDFKVDTELIHYLVKNFHKTIFHFVGPGELHGIDQTYGNVVYHGFKSPELCQKLMQTCKIGIIPYKINEYTKGVLPLKLFEYLQAGCTVLTTELPSIKALGLDSRLVATAKSEIDFGEKLMASLNSEPKIMEAAELGNMFTWDARGLQARTLIFKLLREFN